MSSEINDHKPVARVIINKLTECFAPGKIELINESHRHSGHGGNPGGDETHFKLYIASTKFAGISRLAAHRMIYDCLAEVMPQIHALTIITEADTPC